MNARLAWGVSGRGMLLRAVVEACIERRLASSVHLVVTDRPLEIEDFAGERGIAVKRVDPTDPRRLQSMMIDSLQKSHIDWLGLTFNRLLAPSVLASLNYHVFNVHMALLPAFPGFGAIGKALASRVQEAGATVHLVDPGIDTGPILGQARCPVYPADTESTLGRRIFEGCLPLVLQVVRSIERGDLWVEDGMPRRAQQGGMQDSGFPVAAIDPDLTEFSARFCRKLD